MSALPEPIHFDTETYLTDLQGKVDAMSLSIQDALARLRNTSFRVPGETDDHHAYRKHRVISGPLSDLGEQVMLSLLKLGLTDEDVGARMSVGPSGVGARRRKWGRAYGQKG